MDIQEKEAFEAWLFKEYPDAKDFMIVYRPDENIYEHRPTQARWEAWQAAKAQAVPEWVSVEDKLPETEPNTDGVVCAVVCSVGNVYRARYMHDVDVGVDTKYWSEFSVDYHGMEHEHYEINAKITHWMPLPDAPQEPAND